MAPVKTKSKDNTLYLDPSVIGATMVRFYRGIVAEDTQYEFEWAGGYRGHNYKIKTTSSNFLLKIYRDRSVLPWNNFSQDKLASIYLIQQKLLAKGVKVQMAYPNDSGDIVSQVYLLRMHFAVMLEYLAGEHLEPDVVKLEHVGSLINMVSLIDHALAEIDTPTELDSDVNDRIKLQLNYFESELNFLIGTNTIELIKLNQAADSLIADWQENRLIIDDRLGKYGGKPQLIHADLTPHNILFVRDEVSGVLDFDKLQVGLIEEEIGIMLGSWVAWLNLKGSNVNGFVNEFTQLYQSKNQGVADWQLVRSFAKLHLWADYSFALNRFVHSYDKAGARDNLKNTWQAMQLI